MANIKTVYRTAQGKEIDLNKLINRNELTLAVGNMKVNARGDKIGSGGQIIKDTTNGVIVPDQINKQVEPVIVSESTETPDETLRQSPSRKSRQSTEDTD